MPQWGTGAKLRIVDRTEISTPGLLLRRWQPSDAPEVLRALTDAAVKQWNPSPGRFWARCPCIASAASRGMPRSATGPSPTPAGVGEASLAVATLTGWAFDTLGLHRIELCHAVPNVASCRVADKAGYRHEGTLRESYRYGDGFRYDEHIHGRLATDA